MEPRRTKRATVYLDPDLHKALKIKSAHSEQTLSELVNITVRQSLAEDHEDLLAFDERKKAPNLNFEEVLKELRVAVYFQRWTPTKKPNWTEVLR